MIAELHDRLAVARQRVRRVIVWSGISWLVVVALAIVAAASLIDWMFHISPGLRLLFLIVLGGVMGYVALRRLIIPLGVSISDLHLALRIERMHPELEESLSSTVSFDRAKSQDSLAGSAVLRRAVVDRAIERTQGMNFDDIISDRPRSLAIRWLIGTVVAVALLAILDPFGATIAVRRLANPFGSLEWPKRTIFAKVDFPSRMAKGDPFNAAVDISGRVPERVFIEYRFADGQQPPPSSMMPSIESKDRFVGTLEAATQPFDFAIRGGDNETDWIHVNVVPAPDIVDLRLTITPPAYTRLPKVEFPSGRGNVQSVVGTEVTLKAVSNKPITSGKVLWESGATAEAVLDPDKKSLSASFTVTKEDTYRVLLVDDQGMTNEHRSPKQYRVEAIPDTPPEVIIENPSSDIEVTPTVRQPVRTVARDDFGLQNIELRYRIEQAGKPMAQAQPPADAEKQVPADGGKQPAVDQAAPKFERAVLFDGTKAAPKNQPVDYVWDLSPLKLVPGSIITFRTAAGDFRTPEANVGESREVRLRIVSPSDFVRQIDAEQKQIREELDRLRKLQETALEQTTDLSKAAEQKETLEQKEREKLQSTETLQRRVREKAISPDGSIQERIKSLLGKLAANRVDDLDTQKRLALIDSELGRIGEQHLSEIEQDLTRARKDAEATAKPSAASTPSPSKAAASKSTEKSGSSPDPSGVKNTDLSKSPPDAQTASNDQKPVPDSSDSAKGENSPKAQDNAKPQEGVAQSKPDSKSDSAPSQPNAAEESKTSAETSTDKPNKESEVASANESAKEMTKSLADAREHQKQVVQSLDAMMEQLDKWESTADVVNEARELEQRQIDNAKQVDDLAAKTLGKAKEDLDKEERTQLDQAAARQEELRQQLGRLEQKLARQAEKTSSDDPAATQAMKDALQQSKKSNLGGKMSSAVQDIRENRLADAGQSQAKVAESLRELVQSLENRREQDLKRLVKDLREAEQALGNIQEEQKKLTKEMQDAQKMTDPAQKKEALERLSQRQKELKEKAEQFAQKLSRLQARQASKSAGRAANRMDNAAQSMQKDGEGEEAAEQQENAEEQLEEAEQELAQARQEAEEQLSREQLAKVADSIKNIHQRQIAIKDDVKRLDELRAKEGKLTRGQIQSVLGLSRAENGLAEESAALQERLSEAKVFNLVIEEAVSSMRDGAGKLGEREVGPPTQRDIERAQSKFAQLLDSLAKDPQEPGGDKKEGGGQQGEQGGGQGGGEDGIPSIAQIKLLKMLQQEILTDTRELTQAKADTGWNDNQKKDFEKLSKKQGRLADLIHDFMKPDEEEPAMEKEGDKS